MSKKNGLDRNGYAPSIIQNEEVCYYSESPCNIARHEVFYGSGRRALSKKYGCWIWVTKYWHDQLHLYDEQLNIELKKVAQIAFESLYGHDMFVNTFKKNYI